VSLIVEWQGREYDVDLREFSQREMSLIEQKAGLDWQALLIGAWRMQPDALRALFWIIDRRDNKDLTFGDYDGPPLKVWLPYTADWKSIMDDLGKVIKAAAGEDTPETDGSASSPSDADTPLPNTTL
jgi:hypothetical protein